MPVAKPKPSRVVGGALNILFCVVICALLVGPLLVVIIASLTTTKFVVFPPQGFTLHWYAEALADPSFQTALAFSLWLAVISALISTVLAILLALAIRVLSGGGRGVTASGPLTGIIRSIGVVPLLLPAIVVALALLTFFTQVGLQGSSLAFVVAHTLVTLPFAFIMVEVGMANVRDDMINAAQVLGAGSLRILLVVILPLAAGGIAAALAFSFILSFGEFTISVFLQSPDYVTIPVQIYNALYNTPLGPKITAISGVVAIVTLLCMAGGLALVKKGGGKLL